MEKLIQLLAGARSRWRQFILRLRGVRIDGLLWLRHVSIPRNPWDIHLARGVMLDENVTLLTTGPRGAEPRILIGPDSYLNRNVFIDATSRVEIGRQVLIGPFCYLTDHDHGLEDRQILVNKPTIVSDYAWLGAHVVVLKGVTIGTGAIVGAGSVVTRSIPAFCVAVGNPARVLKMIQAPPTLESP